ncbi:hypothetical protein GOV10_01515 [Candidatus Woesearchaeota archaeon]|nr:hypothetical protein [Candidatus Woesearchaeota archaeon]
MFRGMPFSRKTNLTIVFIIFLLFNILIVFLLVLMAKNDYSEKRDSAIGVLKSLEIQGEVLRFETFYTCGRVTTFSLKSRSCSGEVYIRYDTDLSVEDFVEEVAAQLEAQGWTGPRTFIHIDYPGAAISLFGYDVVLNFDSKVDFVNEWFVPFGSIVEDPQRTNLRFKSPTGL